MCRIHGTYPPPFTSCAYYLLPGAHHVTVTVEEEEILLTFAGAGGRARFCCAGSPPPRRRWFKVWAADATDGRTHGQRISDANIVVVAAAMRFSASLRLGPRSSAPSSSSSSSATYYGSPIHMYLSAALLFRDAAGRIVAGVATRGALLWSSLPPSQTCKQFHK